MLDKFRLKAALVEYKNVLFRRSGRMKSINGKQ